MALPVCPAVRQCFAIGTYQTASAFTFLIEHLSGGEWQPLTAPLPAGASSTGASQPGGIACPSQGWCVAVGGYIAGSEWEGVIDTYSKGAWHSSRAPLPAGTTITSAKLTSVACAAAGSCAATGLLLGSGGNTGFLETLSNGRWSAEVMPTPQPSLGGVANAIACPAVGSCDTVGSYATNDTTSFPVADVLSDGTWSEVALPLPADDISGSVVEFSAMSCPAAGSCVAVGVYHPGTLEQAVVETLAGGTWSAVRAPTPTVATGMSVLNGVACTGLASCTAIGQYRTGSSSFGMVDTLTGGTWSSIAAPLPAGGTTAYSNLTALSCVPPDACVAVGDYVTPTTAPAETQVQGLIDSEDSGPWVGLQSTSFSPRAPEVPARRCHSP